MERTTASTSVTSNLDDWLSWEAQAMPAAPAPTTNTRLGLLGSDIGREREAGRGLDRREPWVDRGEVGDVPRDGADGSSSEERGSVR